MKTWKLCAVTALLSIGTLSLFAQCPTTPPATEAYGTNSWIGYVYDGVDNFTSNYYGTITETQNFDRNFCDNCNFNTGAPNNCAVNTETHSIRYRMRTNYGCGTFRFTIGGDDGVRLIIDGVTVVDIYTNHPYQTATGDIFLTNANHDFVIEYFENSGQSRVSFSSALVVAATAGTIGNSQTLCQNPPIDPAAFTNVSPAIICAGTTPTYDWERSANGTTGWTSLGINNAVYDIPSGFPSGSTLYYRRVLTNGPSVLYTNVVSVTATATQGDQVAYGANVWRGYVYDGASNNFTTNYRGFLAEPTTFDESFCGDNCSTALNGCDIVTESFTVRFKMAFTPPSDAGYIFTVGGDDGYRLSINGGTSWLINNYGDHGYVTTTSAKINFYASVTYNLILEYYENGGGNRVSFNYSTGTLPVTWSFLNGYTDGIKNVIEWHTASEKINKGFEIERSLDGTAFNTLGWVEGNGTTLEKKQYSFVDPTPSSGWNYYRLKQIDLDGKFEYSKIIPVSVGEKLSIYPNPVRDELYVSGLDLRDNVQVSVTNLVTRQTFTLRQDNLQPSHFLLSHLAPGIYNCNVSNGSQSFTQKIVIH